SAIAETRLTSEDRAKADEKADGKDSYLAILTSPRARARVRGGNSEPQPTKAAGQAVTAHEPVASPSVENEAAEISTPITEPQAAPQPESDLTNLPSPQGQVAAIQPETANYVGEAQKVERRSPKPEDAGSIPAPDANAG